MTREEIMAMPAGRDLDRLVADALGYVECFRIRYSTSIVEAFTVWEVMRQKVPYVQLCQEGAVVDVCVTVNERKGPYITATADTVPLAICRAFLAWKLEAGK